MVRVMFKIRCNYINRCVYTVRVRLTLRYNYINRCVYTVRVKVWCVLVSP